MINDKTVLAIIPARGGSKQLPRKNILNLAGKPLIAWTIEAAHASKYIDKCIVSTEDKEIAYVAKSYKCEIPFMRPRKYATDDANSNDVVLHAIEKINGKYNFIMVLQPTSPLRTTQDIDQALEVLYKKQGSSLVSISKAQKPIQWYFKLENDGRINPLYPSMDIANRQDAFVTYLPNGAIYLSEISQFKALKTFYTESTLGYVMPLERSIDIDNKIDFYVAESILS